MSEPAPSIGQVFGHYRLIEQIGAGGMGVVFRAHDEQLRRDVAVKILPHSSFADAASRERFRKEALAVGRLNHPNIAMAFDFGETNGVDYLVTEYIPGVNLDEKIGKQPLPQKTVLELGIQLLSGLEAAHRENVIHRDLKPGNIRLNRDGQLKILDFGLAKLTEPIDESAETANVSATVSVSGTVPYMAPELLRAEPSDARADIWAAGAVLYEMATGKRAFPDKQPSLVIDAILHYDPVRPTLLNPKITPSLEAVILKTLDRDPDRRYQSAREFRVDLTRLLAGGEIATDTLQHSQVKEIAEKGRQRKFIWVLLLVLLLGLALGLFLKRWPPMRLSQQKILAVLPIETVGQDSATNALGLGLTETLTAKLVQASDSDSVQVVSPRDLRDEKVRTAEDARRSFSTDYVLESSLQRSGQVIRINCYLVDSKTHRQIAARTIESDASDTFKLQDEVVNAALDMLPEKIKAGQRNALTARPDTQPAAYEAYIRGRGYLLEYEKRENIDNAITEFTQALKVDPKYAPAYAGLGTAYLIGFRQLNRSKEWLDQAGQNCEKSLSISPNIAEAHVCVGDVLKSRGDYDSAARQFQTALRLDSNSDEAFIGLADCYQHLGNAAAAEAAYKSAIKLRPNYWGTYSSLGDFYSSQSRFAEAAEAFRKVTELAPDNYRGYSNLGGVYAIQGRYPEAIATLKRSIELRPNLDAYGNLGAVYFYLRRYNEAADTFQQSLQLESGDYMNWGNLGDALYWTPNRRSESAQAYRKAMQLAEAKLQINSRDASTLSFLAYYEAMAGNKNDAIKNISRAIALMPGNSEILLRAASISIRFGDQQGTLSWLHKAVAAGLPPSQLLDTPEFQPLHDNDDFRALTHSKS